VPPKTLFGPLLARLWRRRWVREEEGRVGREAKGEDGRKSKGGKGREEREGMKRDWMEREGEREERGGEGRDRGREEIEGIRPPKANSWMRP